MANKMTNRKQFETLYVQSVKRLVPDTHVSPTKNFDLGEALAGVYPILDLIFDYLPAHDLKSCSKVSQSWSAKSLYALSKRRAPSWFTCYRQTRCNDKILHSPNLNYNNAAIGFIFYDNCQLKLNGLVRLQNNTTSRTVYEYFEEELLPKNVDYCMLAVHRAMSYFDSSAKLRLQSSIFDGVFIPEIPSVRTVMFECNPRRKSELEKIINLHVKPHEQTKCLLIFSKSKLHKYFYNLLDFLVPKSTLVALGGGIIKSSKTLQQKNTKIKPINQAVCVAFLKDKNSKLDNFEAYSYYIDDPDLTKHEFTLKLASFKRNIVLKRYSLAFRICCVAKHDGENELESFEEVFPGLPLAGLDAHGEFGFNCYPNASVAEEDKTKDYPKVEHEYTTVFVIITWD